MGLYYSPNDAKIESRFKVDLHCFFAEPNSGRMALDSATSGKWVPVEELSDYPFPAANVRLIQKLKQ